MCSLFAHLCPTNFTGFLESSVESQEIKQNNQKLQTTLDNLELKHFWTQNCNKE